MSKRKVQSDRAVELWIILDIRLPTSPSTENVYEKKKFKFKRIAALDDDVQDEMSA